MSRFVLIRESSSREERLVEESSVPTEAFCIACCGDTRACAGNRSWLRAIVTVGFETNLVSGRLDLVLMTAQAVPRRGKEARNTDTRRVVAQVMDYAAALWGKTLEEFEAEVLLPCLGNDDSRSLREFVVGQLLMEARQRGGSRSSTRWLERDSP